MNDAQVFNSIRAFTAGGARSEEQLEQSVVQSTSPIGRRNSGRPSAKTLYAARASNETLRLNAVQFHLDLHRNHLLPSRTAPSPHCHAPSAMVLCIVWAAS